MLSQYTTEEKFLKGVSIYLKKHLYANSVTKDLWEGIAEASGMSPFSNLGLRVLTLPRSRCSEGHG